MSKEKIVEILSKLKGLDFHLILKYCIIASISALIVCAIAQIVYFISQIYHNHRFRKTGVCLKITPKDTCDIEELSDMLMNIHGFLLNTSWRQITGGNPYCSFEIVGEHKNIAFYAWIPAQFEKILAGQIYKCYPDCSIEHVEDHMTKRVGKYIRGMRVVRGYNYTFSFRGKADIVPSVLSAISGLPEGMKVVLQVIAKPLDRGWQVKARKVTKQFEKEGIRPGDIWNKNNSANKKMAYELELDSETGDFSPTRDRTMADRLESRGATKKFLQSGYEVTIRVLAEGDIRGEMTTRVKAVAASFTEMDEINRFKMKKVYMFKGLYRWLVRNRYSTIINRYNILTPIELCGVLFRLPSEELKIPEILRNLMKQFAPPLLPFERWKNIIGNIVYRGKLIPIGIKPIDFRQHCHVSGATGTGKTKLLEGLVKQARESGMGIIVLDPHGDLVLDIIASTPDEALDNIILLDFSDSEYPVPFNFMKMQESKNMPWRQVLDETAEELFNVLKNFFSSSWGVRTEKIFMHTIRGLLETEVGSLWNAKMMLKDKGFRDEVTKDIKNIAVREFWETEFHGKVQSDGTFKLDSDVKSAIDPVLTKLDRFLTNPTMLNMIAQDDCVNFHEIINSGKIVLVRIPKGDLKAENTRFLGQLFFSKLIMAFMSRTREERKRDTLLIMDEFQNFIAGGAEYFNTLMDELRKYGLLGVLAHQRVTQIESILSAIRDNVGTTISFRLGDESAAYMKKAFGKVIDEDDLKNLENRHAYVRLQVDGKKTDPFLMKTQDIEIIDKDKAKERIEKVIASNRSTRKSRAEIEAEIRERLNDMDSTVVEETKHCEEMDSDFVNALLATRKSLEANGIPDEWN